jgi:glycosyltransferase involved in cell wall biosynthesis
MMKIAIDTRDLKKGKTGTYTYLDSLSKAFKLTPKDKGVSFMFIHYPLPVYNGSLFIGKFFEHLLFTIWKQIVIPIYCCVNKIDLLFCTDYFLPLVKMKTKKAVVFHDAFFYEEPWHYNTLWLKSFHWIAVRAAKKADLVIVPTNYVKNRLSFFIPQLAHKIKVVYEGPQQIETGLQDQVWNKEIADWLSGSPFILHVGTLDYRKNLIRLIESYEILMQKNIDIKIIIAGDSPKYFSSNGKNAIQQTIKERNLNERIKLTGRVSEFQLDYLYKTAHLYVFPSTNEGFGLPMVEAMKYRLPIAASNNTALPEVGGNAAIYFDPTNTEDIANKIGLLIADEHVRQRLKEAAGERMHLFDWQKSSDQLIQYFIQTNNK